MRALVIEDDVDLREQVCAQLRSDGFAVDATGEGEEGLFFACEYPIDIAIIDLGLPGPTGLDIIREVREAGLDYPILILTARSRWQDKVEGLETGADDYVVKPFQPEELTARIQALVRRSRGWAQPKLESGDIVLDTARQEVFVADEPVELTAYEYRVLEHLMLHAGEVVSKTALTEHIYEENAERDSNVIEVFVRRLRAKLDPEGTRKPIETLRGRGYRLSRGLSSREADTAGSTGATDS
ncbi:response regulator transcription factor [Endozoicomonas sp. G2_2]|uniref:response regulator transcription factor n=1 Tax=Gammaproteobacteria TaxID=1236 RepID=UPI000C372C54|nr:MULTISPECIES: response regulator transcription factor [Gammaproteobacteria]MAS10440.1 DNA-binding response regulator [Salinisphaera sp.]MBO9470114.1 response regulator transcription factor [Endozoicomonas sp. G2_2]|tara:strand:+ start:64 stop:786 length:723 start_codon:yes stop_codon:yes gene_type:complete